MEEDWLGASKCLCLGNLDVEDDGLLARCVEGICAKIKIGQAKRVVLEQYVNVRRTPMMMYDFFIFHFFFFRLF